jgi:hypothetical protein
MQISSLEEKNRREVWRREKTGEKKFMPVRCAHVRHFRVGAQKQLLFHVCFLEAAG